tara:strand:- start:127 stop:471 length:345 start_codon:yes stop_codon:yes gene_type:complete
MNNFLKTNHVFFISIVSFPAALIRWQIDKIFVVNIIGCFLLGFINSLPISRKYKFIFGFGFCGSLTTFSGWSLQLFKLIQQGLYKLFVLNSILSMTCAILAVGFGHLVAKKIVK